MTKPAGVDAVERALSLLDAFSGRAAKLSLSDLARNTGLYHSTILRLVASLEKFGYLRRDADRQYRLGPAVMRLASAYQANFDLADQVRPLLRELCEAAGESAAFYVRDGDRRICLYRHNVRRMVSSNLEEGAATSLEVGASSRILKAHTGGPYRDAEDAAFHEQIRKAGYYVSRGEREPDLCGIAAPVFCLAGKLIGSLGIAGPLFRFPPEAIPELRDILLEHAARLSRNLGAPQPNP